MDKDEFKKALREYDREKCARGGHDWQIFNWIGQGQTRTCKRCGHREGLKSVDADGTIHYYGEGENA